jgi:hypothetical protein
MTTINSFSSHNLALNWLLVESASRSTACKIALVVGDVFCIVLSGVICIPSVLAALSEASGSLWQRLLAFGSAAGTGLDWFILTSYGLVVLIHSFRPKRAALERRLFGEGDPLWARIAQIAFSIFLGLATRAPAITEAVVFSHNTTNGMALGLVSAVGEAGLPALGQYFQIELLKQVLAHQCGRDIQNPLIEKIRKSLIRMTKSSLEWGLKSTLQERKVRFLCLYQRRVTEEMAPLCSGLEELISTIVNIYKTTEQENEKAYARRGFRAIFQVGGSMNAIGLFVMDALLAKTFYDTVMANPTLSAFGMAFAVLPILYIMPKMAAMGAGKTVDLVTDFLGVARHDKSFADQFYPKLTKFLKLSCALLSVLQYDEQIALSKLYASKDSLAGKFLSTSNIIACSLIITCSFYELIEEMLERFALSAYSSKEIRSASLLKQKLGRFITLLKTMHPVAFRQIINEIQDEALKKTLLQEALSQEELLAFLNDKGSEEDALLGAHDITTG